MLPKAKHIFIKDAIIVEKCMYGHIPVTNMRKGKFNDHKKFWKNAGQNPSRYRYHLSRHMHVDG